jgi:hypothetical protein
MSTPRPPEPGETPEQRQARLNDAARVQQRIDAEMRAEEAARVKKASTPPTPKAPPTNPFTDPNYALRQLNEYFGGLRKDYGEGAIRGAGFTPRDLSLLQASLRKLQMDPNATPEQHRQAYQQARDALAQRITTPLAASRPTPSAPPEVEVRGVRPEMPENAPFMDDYLKRLAASRAAQPTPVVPDVNMQPITPPSNPVPSATDYISSMVTPPSPINPSMMSPTMLGNAPPMPVAPPPMAGPVEPPLNIADDPSRGVIDNRIGPGFGKPMQPDVKPSLGDMLKGGIGSMLPPMQSTPMQPTAPGILSGIMPMQPAAPSMNTQPGADFDRNVARQIFDAEFRTLREKYGDQGLRAAGFTPRTLASLQAPLTNVQKDNTISYDQSSAALENALKQLRGYNFGGAQPAAPVAAPAAQGMAMGGLMDKYYR